MRKRSRSTSLSAGRPGDSLDSPREDEASEDDGMSGPEPTALSLQQVICLLPLLLLNSSALAEGDGTGVLEPCSLGATPRYAEWMTLEEKFERILGNDGPSKKDCTERSLGSTLNSAQCSYCVELQTVVCAGEMLIALPDASLFPREMLRLRVSESSLTKISAGAFVGIDVESIDIDYNLYLEGEVEGGAFEGVTSLKYLNITRSGLKEVRPEWFRGLDTLEVLSLQENDIDFHCDGFDSREDSREDENSVYATLEDVKQEIWVKCSDKGAHCGDETRTLLPQLRSLDLGKNKISCLLHDTFLWLKDSRLEYLSLQGTSLKIADNETLLPVSKTLRMLDISDSTLTDSGLLFSILSSLRGNGSRLEDLKFSCLGLNRMPKHALTHVSHSLLRLSLYGNYFHSIGKKSFPKMNKLQKLDLRQCDIKVVEVGSFGPLPNLTTLLLANNRISYIDGMFIGLNYLSHLDLSYNLGVKLVKSYSHNAMPENLNSYSQIISNHSFPSSLISLDLSFTEIHKLEKVLFNGLTQLKYLSICYTKIAYLDDKSQPFGSLKNLIILEMSGNTWLEKNLHGSIFKGLTSLEMLYLNSISTESYSSKCLSMSNSGSPFQNLPSLRLLSLKQNSIRIIDQLIFSPLENLEELYLSNNHLISWEENLFSKNRKLRTLTLHQNQLSYISDVMLLEFRILSKISLFDNPFLCNCKVWELTKLAKDGVIHIVDWDKTDTYMCIDRSKNIYNNFDGDWGTGCDQSSKKSNNDSSQSAGAFLSVSSWSTSIPYILIICGASVVCALVLVHRKWNYIRYFGRLIKNMAVIGLMSEEEKVSQYAYNYDVFVSYCDHDRSWVLNELLPNLELKDDGTNDSEQPGPAFKVCLHERDFQVGYSILENIITCMDNSRMILLVVSITFLRSQWCQFEMHLAQHRLLETRRDDLLLVLLEEIPRAKRPKTLHYLMVTKTYLVWNTETPQDLFWKRLRRAIRPNPARTDTSISSFP